MKNLILHSSLVLFLSIGVSPKTFASHMMGADIAYKCKGNNVYDFVIKVYRDCRGIPFNSPTMQIKCVQGGTTTVTPSYSRTNIRDITPTCASAGKKCDPKNTTISSSTPAIEEHEFTYTYDFSTMKKNGCCKVQVGTGQCCRNGAITTGGAGNNFWTYCEIDLCINSTKKCNSSPSLTSEPIAILCCNQPYYYNNGASDTTDFDSLSYEFTDPLQSWNQKTNWGGSYNSQNPFAVYWPSGYDKNKGPRPDANPPIGTYLDPETGDIVFTPTDCNETTIASIRVTEWRKDTTGAWQKIGITHRDIQFIVQTCPGNNPPILNGPYKYDVCAGTQICFTITSDDKQFIPPPPAKANPPDTVTLTWNRGIPGATFTIVNTKARLQSGKFCWTPKKNQASDLPYTFTVTARDNSCPLNAVTVKSYSVKVKPIAETERDVDTLICGAYTFTSNPFPNFKGTPEYLWEVSDSNNNILDNSYYYFKPKGGIRSTKSHDTIQFRKGGKYIIHHRINNAPLNCPTDYFDTLVVPPLLEVDLALGPDTFVCAGTVLRLGAKTAYGLPKFNYKWLTPIDHDREDTLSYKDVWMTTHDTTFRVEITDANKCVAFDTINIFLKPNPKVDMGPDLRICWDGEVSIFPNAENAYWIDPDLGDTLRQGDTLWWSWAYYGVDFSTDTSATFNQEGIYTVTVRDSLGCNWTDTMMLHVNDTLFPNAGPDQTKCFNDTLILKAQGLDSSKKYQTGSYTWYQGLPKTFPFSNKQTLTFKVQKSDPYLLELKIREDTTTCTRYDTAYITVNPLPVLKIVPPQKYCCDFGNISLSSSLYATPTGGTWACSKTPSVVSSNVFLTPLACDPKNKSLYTLRYTYQDPSTKCINKDSTVFTINPLPQMQLKGGYYCQDKIEAPLKPHILFNLNSMPQANWKVLRSLPKPGGGVNTVNDLIYDADPSFNYDFRLKVDKGTIDLGSSDRDSLIFELTIQSGDGCFNKDTLVIYIWKIPVITFSKFPDLCIDEGIVNLKKITNTKPDDGCWTVIDSNGYRNKNFLQPGMVNCDTLNTLLLNVQNGPGLYWMRYVHTSSGCPVSKDTMLRINPLPNVNISITPNQNQGKYCEIDGDVTLNANPAGGTWSSSVPGVISGGKFKPTSVSAAERDKWITLTYTYVHPQTKCDTSKSLQVFVQSKPTIDIVTADIDTCRSNVMDMTLLADYKFTSKISWVHNADPAISYFAGNQQLSNNNPAVFTIRPRSDSMTRVVVTAFTEAEGVCPFATDNMVITIHPTPHVSVAIDDPDGCQPHTATFTTTVLNGIDPANSKYAWDFGDGSFDDKLSTVHTFNNVGTNNVTFKVTSEFGCDTLIGPMPIDVYPIPVADFTPNPNNSTTAALPRFSFNNQSAVLPALGSKLISHNWDFGDLNIDTDTSTLLSPQNYYYSSDTGTYYVRLIVETNHGCKDTIVKPVIVGPDILVYIPNVFTPDGAGPSVNDKFTVVASGYITYQILIFNRWGEKLYESTKLEEPWDGYYNGELCQMDAYVYQVNVTSFSGELYKYNGTVILLR
ncbi:MAG: gliding motility-associated C-terminal domain-containing protein [Flavobacteriales bacterium]|nr:gliding motility-associated C-terminal domain-containing protein [Flavobacteriales bacterium]